MALRVRTVRDLGEFTTAIGVIGHYFGWAPTDEEAERFSKLLPFERVHAVVDRSRIVAAAGALPFQLTVPGGPVPCAGVTVVGVQPSHRRRGLLRRMMVAQLRDIRERGEPIAALWASEETIYGRFGYGLSSLTLNIDAERSAVRIRPVESQRATARSVDHDEAAETFPRLYACAIRDRPGTIVRSRDWWDIRRLEDSPQRRRGGGPLARYVFERDGRPVGYALYRLIQEGSTPGDWKKTVRVIEAFGVDDAATREVWRFLLEIDWVDRIAAYSLPVDHALPLLVDRVNKLNLTSWDGIWARVVDVADALARRELQPGRVTFEVTSDPQVPDNVGTWTVEDGAVRRARRRPDVRLPIDALSSAYLGGFSFADLVRAGRAEEATRGGVARADDVFRTPLAPWCPENF